MIYVLKGQPHDFIPVTIDGVRTRIKETTGFKAGVSRPVKAKACAVPPAPAKTAAAPAAKQIAASR